jgi:hypothetical protein
MLAIVLVTAVGTLGLALVFYVLPHAIMWGTRGATCTTTSGPLTIAFTDVHIRSLAYNWRRDGAHFGWRSIRASVGANWTAQTNVGTPASGSRLWGLVDMASASVGTGGSALVTFDATKDGTDFVNFEVKVHTLEAEIRVGDWVRRNISSDVPFRLVEAGLQRPLQIAECAFAVVVWALCTLEACLIAYLCRYTPLTIILGATLLATAPLHYWRSFTA